MTVLLAAETLLLILLSVVVVSLLRSHAEILRRLDEGTGHGAETPLMTVRPSAAPSRDQDDNATAIDLVGKTLDGDSVQIGLRAGAQSTLIAFLSSGCLTCHHFWDALGAADPPEIPGEGRLVVVTRSSSHESPSKLRGLAPARFPLVMSSELWECYEVPSSPYFIYIDGASAQIHGEGAATSWSQVSSLLRDALDDQAHGQSGAERAERIEQDLARGGIGPGHPSLYPSSETAPEEVL